MGFGLGASYSGSADDALEVNYQFELFPRDDNNQLRTPVNNPDGSFTFAGAVEDFQARFADFSFNEDVVNVDSGFNPDIGAINITNLFAERVEGEEDETSISETNATPNSATVPDPLTLDLTTRFLSADATPPDAGARIEYIIGGSELESLAESVGFEISDLTLFIEDANGTLEDGFQLDQNPFTPEFEIFGQTFEDAADATILSGTEESILAAQNDIEFIIDNDLLGLITGFTVSVGDDGSGEFGSEITDEVLINRGSRPIGVPVAREPIIIQAEDLNLDVYRVETITTGDRVISLLGASGTTGTASLHADDFSIAPGTYDLTISTFDENDGEAKLEVLLNGSPVDAAGNPIILNEENTASGFPTEEVRREFVIEGIEITDPSDYISIVGTADIDPRGSELARVDFITFADSTEIIV